MRGFHQTRRSLPSNYIENDDDGDGDDDDDSDVILLDQEEIENRSSSSSKISSASSSSSSSPSSRVAKRRNDHLDDEPPIKKPAMTTHLELVEELNLNPLLTKPPLLPLRHIFYHPKSQQLKYVNCIENSKYKCTGSIHEIGLIDARKFATRHEPRLIDQINALNWSDIIGESKSIDKLKQREQVDLKNLFYINDIQFEIANSNTKILPDNLIEYSQFFLYQSISHYRKCDQTTLKFLKDEGYFSKPTIMAEFGQNFNTANFGIAEKLIDDFDQSSYYLFVMSVSPSSQQVTSSALIELNIDKQNELYRCLISLLQQKAIHLNIKSIQNGKVNFEIYMGKKLVLENINEYVSFTTRSNFSIELHYLMTYYFFSKPIDLNSLKQKFLAINKHEKHLDFDHQVSKKCNENLFDMVFDLHNRNETNDITDEEYDRIRELSRLRPMLRPYQVKAIKWMLKREGYYMQNEDDLSEEEDADTHMLYTKVTNKINQTIYYHKYFGLYSFEKPLKIKSENGGILADEMGLGKTLEVLALISINQCKSAQITKNFDINSILSDKQLCDSVKKAQAATFSCICRNLPNGFKSYAEQVKQNKRKSSSKADLKQIEERIDVSEHFEEQIVDESLLYQCKLCHVYTHAKCVNYKDTRDNFLCMLCLTKLEPIESKTTLVVTPSIISYQWAEEIAKHVDQKLRVLVYTGTSNGFVQPRDLAKLDIVITTYDVLAEELSHIFAIENKRQLRNVSRYASVPSPINCLKWWRIVLDEAQMVHATNSKCAEMANRLAAFNRWCVTGTPIGRSLSDLYGLFVFIREDPYLEKKWFNELLYLPYVNQNDRAPMAKAVSKVLWRSSKRNVADQIDIPVQIEKVYWLDFSPFEKHLYERVLEVFRENRKSLFNENDDEHHHHHHHSKPRELQQSTELFHKIDSNLRLDELDRNRLAQLLSPILDLRLTCNHPQLILRKRSFMVQSRTDQTRLLTMERSIEMLEKKTQGECDNIFRTLTMHRNALAGIYVIEENYEKAIEMYQIVLDSESKDYNYIVRLDLLQKIHATYNLMQIMRIHDKNSETDMLEYNLRDYEKIYSISFDDSKVKHENRLREKIETIEEFMRSKLKKASNIYYEWWIEMLNQIESTCKKDKLEEFWNKFNNEFGSTVLSSDQESFSLCGKEVKTFNEIKLIIVDQIDCLLKARDDLIDKLKIFFDTFDKEVVHKAAECHLRREMLLNSAKASKINKTSREYKELFNVDKCHLCVSDQSFKHYVKYLFSNKSNMIAFKHANSLAEEHDEYEEERNAQTMNNNDEDEFEQKNIQSSQNRSDLERFLKVLHYFYRTNVSSYHEKLSETGKEFLDLITGLKDEFKLMRKFWTHTSYSINALDELELCKMRMRLQYPEEKNLYELDYLVKESQIDAQFYQHNNAANEVKDELKRKLGQLHYLKNLKKSLTIEEGKENEEPCSICLQNIGFSWYVLVCGHSFCVACFNDLVRNEAVLDKLKCPLCRVVNSKSAAFLVTTRKQEVQEEHKQSVDQLNSHDKNEKNEDKTIFKNNFVNDLSKVHIRGSCNSAKVEGVVRCLLNVIRQDTLAKCLVFSEHITILELIVELIKENYVMFKYVKDTNSLQKSIQQFKKDANVNVLLMPYSFGANGLNIIEATHVLLVEPTLNKSQEIQAIGRIHRIGQTKPTFVHRFLIRDSIEELVFRLFKTSTSYSSQTTQNEPPVDSTQPNCSKRFLTQDEQQQNGIVEEEDKRLTIADIKDLFLKL